MRRIHSFRRRRRRASSSTLHSCCRRRRRTRRARVRGLRPLQSLRGGMRIASGSWKRKMAGTSSTMSLASEYLLEIPPIVFGHLYHFTFNVA
jgi:hypothetical protein